MYKVHPDSSDCPPPQPDPRKHRTTTTDTIRQINITQISLAQALDYAMTESDLVDSQAATIANQKAIISQQQAQLAVQAPLTGVMRHFERHTGNVWDSLLATLDPTVQSSLRNQIARMGCFAPGFDAKLLWYPNALFYYDTYAIYNPSPLATLHPEWILKDMTGHNLYIPWGCSNGTCPQFAGDIGNTDFTSYQIAQMKHYQAAGGSIPAGYKGIWLDDVNMNLDVGDGNGNIVTPKDPRTGLPMTTAGWQSYYVAYLQAIRAAFPASDLLQNSIWWNWRDYPNDPYIAQQMLAGTYINIERGFGDGGLTGGSGAWSLSMLMNYIDFVHSLQRCVVLDELTSATLAYSLSCYYLVQNGQDMIGFEDLLPASYPPMMSLNLGVTSTPRYMWSGLWRRDFANGIALVNEPQAPTVTAHLPTTMFDETGKTVTSVVMAAKSGHLLRYAR